MGIRRLAGLAGKWFLMWVGYGTGKGTSGIMDKSSSVVGRMHVPR